MQDVLARALCAPRVYIVLSFCGEPLSLPGETVGEAVWEHSEELILITGTWFCPWCPTLGELHGQRRETEHAPPKSSGKKQISSSRPAQHD